jgi:hypothetical protein
MFPSITYFRKDVRSGMNVNIPTMMVGNKSIYIYNRMISWEEIIQVTEIQMQEISRSADYVNYRLLKEDPRTMYLVNKVLTEMTPA